MVLHYFPLWSLSVALGAFWVPPGCFLGAFRVPLGVSWVPSGCLWVPSVPGCLDAWMPGCLDAWMPGCLDARMPGCLDAWMPGCLDAWMHEIDDLLVKKCLTSFFELSGHQIGTILKSFALTFQSASI